MSFIGPGEGGGGTLIFSYIRRLGSFFEGGGVQILIFNISFFLGGGGSEK